ncbi:MAG: ATP-binding cassette domain-containing protein [Treponema sp.]|nr:ATP-binding cassette domain-containing protein [Treponema sp.]
MSVISVENLVYKYPLSKKNAVDNLSFVIEKGSYTAIVGYNGSGKSTLARLLCGLENPESGSIKIKENQQIGIVFQHPKDQLVSGLVSRDTAFGPQNLGLSNSEVELRTIESLNIVDMLDRSGSSTSALSLGQTQKIALSGVIALRPEILILDEAISMLDPQSRSDILDFVRYWHKCGNTIIQITHDLEVLKDADTVIGMEDGKIFFYGTRNAFIKNPENVKRLEGQPLPVTDKKILAEAENKVVSLSVRNLNFSYDKADKEGKAHGVKDINFDLYKGSVTALTGPSGSGKSTILELCSGLLSPDNNSEASISAIELPTMALQNAKAALFEAFAADDVAFGPRNRGKTGSELKELVRNSMDDAALPFLTFGERKTFALSGGEQRRLSIAGILALNSDIVFFDEPTAGLDSRARNEVLNLFQKLAAQGKTVLFSTHKRDEADFADREIKIRDGKIIEDSCPLEAGEALGAQKALEKVEVSSSVGLLSMLRNTSASLSGARREKKYPVEKIPPALRIILFLVLFVFSLLLRNTWQCAVFLAISVIYCLLSGFKFSKLCKAWLKILPFLLIFTVFQLIFHAPQPGEVHFTNWRWLTITPSKLWFCLTSILRTYSSLACISAFFVSTPEYDLIDGLKILLFPLSLIKLPVRYLILVIEIIFRFIPVLVDEASSIIKTQIIRGGLGKASGKMAKLKALVPLFVPLIIQSIKKSELLADAITMRCFR